MSIHCLHGLSSQSLLRLPVPGWVCPTMAQKSLLSMREILVSVDFDFFPSICFPLFQPHPTPSCLSEHFSLSCPEFPSSARSALFFPGSMISSFCSHFSATSGHPHGLAHPFTQNLLYSYYSTAILEKSILLWSHLSVISLFHVQSETARPLRMGVFQTSRDV